MARPKGSKNKPKNDQVAVSTPKRGRGRPKNTGVKNMADVNLPDANNWQGYRVSAWISAGIGKDGKRIYKERIFEKERDSRGKATWKEVTEK